MPNRRNYIQSSIQPSYLTELKAELKRAKDNRSIKLDELAKLKERKCELQTQYQNLETQILNARMNENTAILRSMQKQCQFNVSLANAEAKKDRVSRISANLIKDVLDIAVNETQKLENEYRKREEQRKASLSKIEEKIEQKNEQIKSNNNGMLHVSEKIANLRQEIQIVKNAKKASSNDNQNQKQCQIII